MLRAEREREIRRAAAMTAHRRQRTCRAELRLESGLDILGEELHAGRPRIDANTASGLAGARPSKLDGERLKIGRSTRLSVELSKARAAKPDAVFAFYPGGRRAVPHPICPAGLKAQIPLYILCRRCAVIAAARDSRWRSRREHWVNDLPTRPQEVRRGLPQEIQRILRSMRRKPTTPALPDRQRRGGSQGRSRQQASDAGRNAQCQYASVRGHTATATTIPDPEFLSAGSVKDADSVYRSGRWRPH